MLQNARHVHTARAGDAQGGGNYTTLMDYLNRRRIYCGPYIEGSITVNGQYILIDSSHVSGNIAVGASSNTTNGGIVAAQLAGAVGTAATTAVQDDVNHYINLCEIRDSATNDPLVDASGRRVYALFQCADSVTDGDAIGAAAAENVQVSFVTVGADSNFSLVTVIGDIEISFPFMYAERHMPAVMKEGVPVESDVVAALPEPLVRKYLVTSAFAADEVITVSTGDGAISGLSIESGDTIASIGPNATAFTNDNRTRVRVNGEQLTKGVEVIWDSSTTFHFVFALDPGDSFEIEVAEEI